jgi:hypothetical protein
MVGPDRRRSVMSGRTWLAGLALLALASTPAAQGAPTGKVPTFEPDQTFPRLPNNWVLGAVAKVVVDRHDNVWMVHRPRNVAADKVPAPPVVEFDAAGRFLQAWGGDGAGYDWPDTEHNIFVDHKDNVWISGTSPSGQSKTTRSDDMLLKFTNQGKFLLQVGGRSVSLGSRDPKSVNKPGDLFVSAKANEVYIADGYGNRRVIVFDADTGAFKRMWGAFGNPPEDDAASGGRGASGGPLAAPGAPAAGRGRGIEPAVLDTEGPGAPRFGSPVHGVVVSNDNIVYVADRTNRRVQLFTPEGKYLRQMFVNRAGPAAESVCGFAFSPDKDQHFLYIADFGNSHIVVVDRKKLEVLYQFGKRGAAPGDFQGVHHIAVDSKGNLYAAEVAPGARIQRFVFKGLSSTLPANARVPEQRSR